MPSIEKFKTKKSTFEIVDFYFIWLLTKFEKYTILSLVFDKMNLSDKINRKGESG